MYSLFLALLLVSCGQRPSHLDTAYLLMQKNDKALARDGVFEFMTVHAQGPLIGNFKKHYITKQYHLSDVNEARGFFCCFVDSVVEPLNREKSIRPYLQSFPMTFRNFDLQIVFVDEEDAPLLPPNFCSIRKVGDKIYYEHYDPSIQKSVAFCIEQADRAFRIYRSQLSKV